MLVAVCRRSAHLEGMTRFHALEYRHQPFFDPIGASNLQSEILLPLGTARR